MDSKKREEALEHIKNAEKRYLFDLGLFLIFLEVNNLNFLFATI